MTDDRPRSPFQLLHLAQRTAARRLHVDGAPWLVYELPANPFDRRSSLTLVFETDDTMRRVRSFPANWRTLSDADLFALSWTR